MDVVSSAKTDMFRMRINPESEAGWNGSMPKTDYL